MMSKIAAFANKPETSLAVSVGLILLAFANALYGNWWVAAGLIAIVPWL